MSLNAELSSTNESQLRALRLLERPEIQAAKAEGERKLVKSLPFVDSGSMEVFPSASQEIAIAALLFALMDPEYPIILCTELMPRTLDGVMIPGSRVMDDNPDTVYRFIPIHVHGKYVIKGRYRPGRPIIHQFSLISESWTTQQNLAGEDLICDEDGTFTIHVDAEPPAGRANHIQSKAGACFMQIRDTLCDWSSQMPTLLQVRRINPPARPPQSDDDVIERCIEHIRDWYAKTIRLHDEAVSRDANVFPQPLVRNGMAMLVTQAYAIGRFALTPETAVVLTLRMGGARYLNVVLTNLWGITNDAVSRQASLNMLQAARNGDGSFTFVLSLTDPGVLNWIDPGDLPQGILFLRWAAIDPDHKGPEQASVESVTLPLVELMQAVPTTMPRVDRAERRTQLDRRAQLFERRWN